MAAEAAIHAFFGALNHFKKGFYPQISQINAESGPKRHLR